MFASRPPHGVLMYDLETRCLAPAEELNAPLIPHLGRFNVTSGWCVKCRTYNYIEWPSQLCTQPPFRCVAELPGELPPDSPPKTAG